MKDKKTAAEQENANIAPGSTAAEKDEKLYSQAELDMRVNAECEKLRKKLAEAEKLSEMSEKERAEHRRGQLEKELAAKEAEAENAAVRLREKRLCAAERLTGEISESLRFLDMPKVRFRVALMPLRDNGRPVFRPDGCDDVDFLISVNAGEELGSLGKVSSGGELSRITLALKTALAKKNESATLVFDEIDTGVSGGTSERIGIMLLRLSENAQVISVTHSPQIASIAPRHLLIEKSERDGRTESNVREITGDERTAEIARIIGGIDVTEKQTVAAEEMLAKNRK